MPRTVLAIESSCDETAVAIVDENRNILSSCLKSQTRQHAPFGGVVPEVAARAHVDVIYGLVKEAVSASNLTLKDISAFAATAGPGLAGGLMIANVAAKTLALAHQKPFVAVNHLEGHVLTPTLFHPELKEFLVLLVSGGHCLLAYMPKRGCYQVLGQTLDDAVGEAFDKTARLLQLGYPGGPLIEALAKKGVPALFPLPATMTKQKNCNFSFSGLKTAVARAAPPPLSTATKQNVAASFQKRIIEQLLSRTRHAIEITNAQNFTIVGGVAANAAIRTAFQDLATEKNIRVFFPPLELCTDNAVMIAWVAVQQFCEGITHPLDFPVYPRWSLSDLSSCC